MFYHRDIEPTLERFKKFPAIALLGPRQSGKSTLARNYFKKHTFVSFEDPAIRAFAAEDPKGFLQQYEKSSGVIFDEFQYVPELLSYIQIAIDADNKPGFFVLTGSQNFLMNQAISQSLAGRVGILTLLPFSIHELSSNNLIAHTPAQAIINGGYPRLYAEGITAQDLYPSYITTYIERDVRLLMNVGNLATFQKFLSLCAGRIGQLLNLSDIAVNCGISVPTAQQWFSILESSYIAFRLQPHFSNFNKRITKTPKLYFYDTGVACSLLNITSKDALQHSPFMGNLFENYIIADFFKQYYNAGSRPPLYFWRDRNGLIEVDAMVQRGNELIPIEIKSGQTVVPAFFTAITKWNSLSDTVPENNYIVYGGDQSQKRVKGHIIGWRQSGQLIKKLS